MGRMAQKQDIDQLNYDSLLGVAALREQIARLTIDSGCQLTDGRNCHHHRLP